MATPTRISTRRVAPQPAARQLPRDVEDDDRREEEQVVAARQVLHQPGGRRAGQRLEAAASRSSRCSPKSTNGIHADDSTCRCGMFAMRYGANANARPGDESGGGAAGQLAPEQKHAEPGQRERREEQQVVAEDRILRHRVDRQRLQRLRQEVFGVGQRQRMRREDVRAPPAAPRCVASHAITHEVKSGSPKSPGTSCVRPAASGQVMAIVSARRPGTPGPQSSQTEAFFAVFAAFAFLSPLPIIVIGYARPPAASTPPG